MSRLQATFAALGTAGRKALIPYVTAGDPLPGITVDLILAMAEAGADVIELGIPFSDPMADGPVIQRASERALAQGVSLHTVLDMVRQFRLKNQHTPLVLMGYANPIEHYGVASFVQDAKAAGVDGVLVVDYPPEECQTFVQALRAVDMDAIFLLAPTSTPERMKQIGQIASGYVYYVALKGVTGAGHLDTEQVSRMIPLIKSHVSVPVGVGFGIRDAATAKAVAAVADGVVIGSRIVQLLEQCMLEKMGPQQVVAAGRAWLAEIRAALDAQV